MDRVGVARPLLGGPFAEAANAYVGRAAGAPEEIDEAARRR
ncbi:hypothetical protein [Streptosporangium lutulentum]|uniref:Uncharacterized protein n=1 Tax=Streptosporangium lutulentum TaxID=1461250 RepID=A0ABT9QBK3_9ACTN|nr:hypothetical protein [Streptosporangium lutulentum]MDP9844152.1 hypothetical protein [Streptosporangium lutulentum]